MADWVIADTPVPGRPYRSVATADGSAIIVSLRESPDLGGDALAVLSAVPPFELQHVLPLERPRGLTIGGDGEHLCVAHDDGAVTVSNVARAQAGTGDYLVARTATVPGGSTGIVTLAADGRYIVSSEERAGCVSVVDVERLHAGGAALTAVIQVGQALISVVPSIDGGGTLRDDTSAISEGRPRLHSRP